MNEIVKAADILAQAAAARGNGGSQATVIEQSRAVAEVQSAFLMAAHRPRDRAAALNQALESCKTYEVAESAFFKFPRGGQSVAGETVHLARELARCWGNIFYTIAELDRDDDRHRSEMVAYAIDLETNTQARLTFIVPHVRDKRGGGDILTDMRDIYENNANMGARRLRECIFAVLPPYLIKAAAEQCRATLESGSDEVPLVQQVAGAIAEFEKIGVSKARIEAKLGPASAFTAVDIANLKISYRSIKRNEISADEEFPRVAAEDTAEELRKQKPVARKGKAADAPEHQPSDAAHAPADAAADAPQPSAEPSEAADFFQEGRADSDTGEAHNDAEPAVEKALRLIAVAASPKECSEIVEEHIASLSDDEYTRVNAAANERAAKLQADQRKRAGG